MDEAKKQEDWNTGGRETGRHTRVEKLRGKQTQTEATAFLAHFLLAKNVKVAETQKESYF